MCTLGFLSHTLFLELFCKFSGMDLLCITSLVGPMTFKHFIFSEAVPMGITFNFILATSLSFNQRLLSKKPSQFFILHWWIMRSYFLSSSENPCLNELSLFPSFLRLLPLPETLSLLIHCQMEPEVSNYLACISHRPKSSQDTSSSSQVTTCSSLPNALPLQNRKYSYLITSDQFCYHPSDNY